MAKKAAQTDDATEAAEPVVPPQEPMSMDDLDVEIAEQERVLAALYARKVTMSIQHYPKMRYKAAETIAKSIETAVTVLDAKAEAEAAADGYTYDGPKGTE